jgi:cell division septation protein DedD
MYNFLFDKKSFTLLLAGLALAGALLFSAGLLAGVQWRTEAPVTVAAVCPPAAPAQPCPETVPATAPLEIQAPAPPPEPAPEPAAGPEPASDVVVAAFQAPPEEPAREEPERVEPEPEGFAVQVGAFSRPENSEKVVEDLKSRGYEPYVVELPGSRRVLHTVRIGRYGDWAEAHRAATDFRRREGMTAIVQPAG